MRRFLAVLAIPAAGIAAAALIPAGSGAFSPGQSFNGNVNGANDNATVYVHVVGDHCDISTSGVGPTQVWTVENLVPGAGKTGSATNSVVSVKFSDDLARRTSTFTTYSTQNIPTGMSLPCGGATTAVFSPSSVRGGGTGDVVGVQLVLAGS